MKNHKAYDDVAITKKEFLTRKQELDQQMEQVRECTREKRLILQEEEWKEIPKEAVREILKLNLTKEQARAYLEEVE